MAAKPAVGTPEWEDAFRSFLGSCNAMIEKMNAGWLDLRLLKKLGPLFDEIRYS